MTEPVAPNAFERASTPYLLWLHRLPRWLLALILIVVLLAGLFIGGPIGATLLVLLAAFLGWLAAFGWRIQSGSSKFLRVVVIGLLLYGAYVVSTR